MHIQVERTRGAGPSKSLNQCDCSSAGCLFRITCLLDQMHGGSGKLDEDQELRVFTSKRLGDDVRIKFRECGMDPDHSAIMTEYGLKPGDRPGTGQYPRVWKQ